MTDPTATPRTKAEVIMAEDGVRVRHPFGAWLRHDDHCPARWMTLDGAHVDGPCNCGLNDALAAQQAPAPEGLAFEVGVLHAAIEHDLLPTVPIFGRESWRARYKRLSAALDRLPCTFCHNPGSLATTAEAQPDRPACNCHHGSAEWCPVHTQADYAAQQAPTRDGLRPPPHALWEQAGGNRDEYLRLMQEHGHLVPGKRPPGEDIFGHAAWRTPSVGSLDLDTLLYVRESIAGIIDVDRGRPFIDALPLIDEIIRLREAAAEARHDA